MSSQDIYLTFKTDKITSQMLNIAAELSGITQPELIDAICKNFIEVSLPTIEKELKQHRESAN